MRYWRRGGRRRRGRSREVGEGRTWERRSGVDEKTFWKVCG